MDRAARRIGQWVIGEELGSGGNARVYRARGPDGREVALKVLGSRKVGGEPYRRFVQEIKFLRSLGAVPGVLSIVETYLPEEPSREDMPWLAMEVGLPIAEALRGASLDTCVDALAEIAETLAALAARGVGHRDLKPSNMYRRGDRWEVGDFGLVAYPEADDDITRAGHALGPAHFIAYEMITDPANADPLPADVFSFGKTIWSLVTGLPYPPLGHQPSDNGKFSITFLRPDRRSAPLDELVDRSTRLIPAARPTMAEVARDLRAWLELATKPAVVDIGELTGRIRGRMAQELAAENLAAERKQLALAAVRQLQEACRPLDETLRQLHPRPILDDLADKLTSTMLTTQAFGGSPRVTFTYQRVSKIVSSHDHRRYAVVYGRGVELFEDGKLRVRTYTMTHYELVAGVDFHWQSPAYDAPVGSIEVARNIERAMADLVPQLEKALAAFAENVPSA